MTRTTTGLVYDDVMTKHRNEVEPSHPEAPERTADTWNVLEARGLTKRCKLIKVGFRLVSAPDSTPTL